MVRVCRCGFKHQSKCPFRMKTLTKGSDSSIHRSIVTRCRTTKRTNLYFIHFNSCYAGFSPGLIPFACNDGFSVHRHPFFKHFLAHDWCNVRVRTLSQTIMQVGRHETLIIQISEVTLVVWGPTDVGMRVAHSFANFMVRPASFSRVKMLLGSQACFSPSSGKGCSSGQLSACSACPHTGSEAMAIEMKLASVVDECSLFERVHRYKTNGCAFPPFKSYIHHLL